MKRNIQSNSLGRFVTGIALGAVYTYFFDPTHGKFRKAIAQEKALRYGRDFIYYGGKILRDLRNRSIGLNAKAHRLFNKDEKVNNEVLVARVRSILGRVATHPRSIQVTANNGIVALSGTILEEEYADIIKSVKKVQGVRNVVEKLDVHKANENIEHLESSEGTYDSDIIEG